MLNLPVSENFALRMNVFGDQHDGYIKAGPNSLADVDGDERPSSRDDTAFRVSSLWDITPDISWHLAYEHFWSESIPGINIAGGADPWQADLRGPSDFDDEITSLRSRLDWDISGNLRFSYLAAQGDIRMDHVQNRRTIESALIRTFDNDSVSHEVQLASTDPNARFEWVAGYFWFEEETFVDFLIDINPAFGLRFLQPDRTAESQAVFGQGTFHITDALGLTLGMRYSEDEKEDVGGGNFTCPGSIDPVSNCSVLVVDNTRSNDWDAFTYRAQADWQFADGGMVYASLATGYKSGGFLAGGTPDFDEETVTTYELGLKRDLLDNSLRLNTALYYSDYEDLQVTTIEQIPDAPPGANRSNTRNAASAEIIGLEVEFLWLPTDNSRISGFASYMKAEFEDYETGSDPVFSSGPLVPLDFSGNQLIRSPEWSFNLVYEYDWFMGNGGIVRPRLSVSWKDDYYLRPSNREEDRQDAYASVDASLRYTSPNDKWSVETFGKNLTDEDVVVNAAGANSSFQLDYLYAEPRTYGVRFDYRWGN